jgi:hypothetical protein
MPLLFFPNYIQKPKLKDNKKITSFSKKLKSNNKKQTLKNVYKYISKNYSGSEDKRKFLFLWKLFITKSKGLIKNPQFIWCHLQNLLLEELLVETGQFKKEDFKIRWMITRWLTIHQYWNISVGEEQYFVDLFYKKFKKL